MLGIARLLQHLNQPDAIEHHTVTVTRTLGRGIVETELHLVPTHRVADLIYNGLDGETYLRRTWRTIRRRLRLVHNHVVCVDAGMRHIVCCTDAVNTSPNCGTGIRASFVLNSGVKGEDLALL